MSYCLCPCGCARRTQDVRKVVIHRVLRVLQFGAHIDVEHTEVVGVCPRCADEIEHLGGRPISAIFEEVSA